METTMNVDLAHVARVVTEKLLAYDFPGRDELQRQLRDGEVVEVNRFGAGGGARIYFRYRADKKAPPGTRSPVAGEADDVDGVPISFILNVGLDGVLDYLDIVRLDDKPIQSLPEPEAIEVFPRAQRD
jgi:hypothetical protein